MGKSEKRALSQKPSAPDFKTNIFGNVLQFPIDWLKRNFFWQGRSSGPICHRIVSLSMETEGVPETSMDGIKEGQRSPIVNTCIYIWMSLVHIEGYSFSCQILKTLPKAQRTRGLSSTHQSNFYRSYHISHKSRPRLIFITTTKHQQQK